MFMENTIDGIKDVDKSYIIKIVYLFVFMFYLSHPCAFVAYNMHSDLLSIIHTSCFLLVSSLFCSG